MQLWTAARTHHLIDYTLEIEHPCLLVVLVNFERGQVKNLELSHKPFIRSEINPAVVGASSKPDEDGSDTHCTSGLALRMTFNAASGSKLSLTIRYAAANATLRPAARVDSGGKGGDGFGHRRGLTHSSLAMNKNAMTLVELGLNECNRGQKVLQNVGRVGVIDVDLLADERLFYNRLGEI